MLIQTFETVLTCSAMSGLHLLLSTPAELAHAFGALLGVIVGIALPLGIAVSAHRQIEKF
ncbi:hypothetical protein [Caballeronia sp. dw_276]|jgi:hypothetical protein|uniref:hypothetical protein n=1 Tax=Caballeronia sp. dw_276 TaxID=2719795 RepID=UPI001BD60ACE|nr:hypothetical protein [Caballeronia sp. dw_276]